MQVVRFLRERHRFEAELFVDLGANSGTHLIRALRGGLFTSGLAVEMDPGNFRLLTANVALNVAGQMPLLVNAAVGDHEGKAVMELSTDNFGDHRVETGDQTIGGVRSNRSGEQSRARQTIRMTTLDRLESELGRPFDHRTLVWIDTQGDEGHVLAGGTALRTRPVDQRPFVVCKFWPYGIERVGGRARLFEFLDHCRAFHNLQTPDWQNRPPLTAADVARPIHRQVENLSYAPRTYPVRQV